MQHTDTIHDLDQKSIANIRSYKKLPNYSITQKHLNVYSIGT